ncbi:MAG: site-specific integrase, partial [Dokdonia donghaensis]|nr:site-specific integrase [Dokdonia donghaensis]
MKWETAITNYKNYLRIERSLSDNTIDNYARDLKKLTRYLEQLDKPIDPLQITREDLQEFVYTIAKEVQARSQARVISGLKGFFNYLVFEDYRTDNPIELIESPKIGRKLPDTLSEEEIDALIDAIDLG